MTQDLTSNEVVRGTLYIIAGLVLVFYTLGLFSNVLGVIIALAGLGLIAYGALQSNLIPRIANLISRQRGEEARTTKR